MRMGRAWDGNYEVIKRDTERRKDKNDIVECFVMKSLISPLGWSSPLTMALFNDINFPKGKNTK